MLDQSQSNLRSSSIDSYHDAANSFSPNHVNADFQSEDEDAISEEEDISAFGGFSSRSRNLESNQNSNESESRSDFDEDGFESDVNNHSSALSPSNFRGSFQQGHAQASLQIPQLTIPKSQYSGYKPPLETCEERVAIQELLAAQKQQTLPNRNNSGTNTLGDEADFEEFELSNFAIYLPPENKWHPCEMRGLQHLTTKTGHGSFYFDGILSTGNVRRYVRRVPFKICSIGNYGEHIHEVGSDIWIQSDYNAKLKSNIFYRLETPSSEYERFHKGFLWLANLAKHLVDFCQSCEEPASLHDFRSNFHAWLRKTHEPSSTFNSWYTEYDNEDFRRAVAANATFLFKESVGVDEELRSQPIWSEIMERDSIPEQKIQETMTVVTPYVYECFKDICFGHHLLPIEPSGLTKKQQTNQGKALDLTTSSLQAGKSQRSPIGQIAAAIPNAAAQVHALQKKVKNIKIGDILSVTKDGQGSLWKDEASRWNLANDCWYVYVQGVHESKNGQLSYDGIWCYSPADTMCALMKYPWPNELFLSDNCTCLHKQRIEEDEILDIVDVIWHGNPSEVGQELCIRQTYLENERFVTLSELHKRCKHLQGDKQTETWTTPNYPVGQTVLVAPSQKTRHELEPYEIMRYITEGSRRFAILKRLHRRREIDGTGRPNELVYTMNQTEKICVSKLERTCLVRFYKPTDAANRLIPAPYNRDGTGNAFYITTRLFQENGNSRLIPIGEDIPKTLIQGFDPSSPPPRRVLRGMDLYCGGGNFGRGIEEGGAVHNEWAVDINKNAIHTYAANLKDPQGTKLFYGSVDDLLKQALQGNAQKSDLIPSPGEVDFISAGSPCQGFSKLNSSRNNERGLKNQSLVASVAAYVDFFRPQYGILENVMAMAQKGDNRDKDVLSQLICALVGMGYQLSLFVLDAWSCGSPQSRTRLFVAFAAPGLEPLEHPQLSHSHPPNVTDRGLGMLANGQSFGRRIRDLTPFEYLTAGDATKDLPRIGDACTYQCTKQPDHVSIGMSTELRNQIRAIPTFPRGMNFSKAWNEGRGVMTEEQRDLFPRFTKKGALRESTKTGSRAWGRVNPKNLFHTIVVGLHAPDCRIGCNLHWDDHRYLTTMEARRAQGFPDDEVLLGTPVEGWKLMGNSVARTVALALGLSLREAWLKNDPEEASPLVKASISLPIVNRRKQSGIEIVIPVASWHSKNGLEPIEGFASKVSLAVNDELAPDSLVKTIRRPVAPNKARRTKSAPDLEPVMGKESASSVNWLPLSSYTARRDIEIPNSAEVSADELSLAQKPLHRFLRYVDLETPSSGDEPVLADGGEGSALSQQLPRKRPHGMMQQSVENTTERTRKVPRVIIPSTSSSSGPASRPPHQQYSKAQPLNPSTLAKKLNDVRREQIRQKPNRFGNDDDEDSDVEIISRKSSAVQASNPTSRVRLGVIKASGSGTSKTPSNEKPKVQVVISLLSDDEDLAAKAGPSDGPSLPSSKYVPIDNNNITAYAQTNRFMNHGKDRKRVAAK
ncbi:hypothetical protein N431DRAFT_469332 [Stipitochalara longipes BDJ]|nr:hypothetical protein N431DRAFT_469332 [Stipitochalara longipes BDJ]